MTRNPVEKLGIYIYNCSWSRDYRGPNSAELILFVGEPEDIPDKLFGFWLSNRREYAYDRFFRFIDYVFNINPDLYADRNRIRERLGYGGGPLILYSIVGTAIGNELLGLFLS